SVSKYHHRQPLCSTGSFSAVEAQRNGFHKTGKSDLFSLRPLRISALKGPLTQRTQRYAAGRREEIRGIPNGYKGYAKSSKNPPNFLLVTCLYTNERPTMRVESR